MRAGLAARARDWPWGSAAVRAGGDAGLRRLLSDWPVDRPADWDHWVDRAETAAELAELEALRRPVPRGCPYGAEAWRQEAAARLGLQSTLRP